ncbi:hypothetical protein J3R82DRAFT_10553 [Butyriboletus roseoflavus]|nr:hypothetical protein J3R82DRAFT_10553 [Butyriboletus roseoflavus]
MTTTTYPNLNALIEAINTETAKILSTESAKITAIHTGNLKIGTNNQYFITWDFLNRMVHDQSMYTWYHLFNICESGDFSLAQCCTLIKMFDTPYSNYLHYSSFPTMDSFVVKLYCLMPTAKDAKDAGRVVRSFLMYLNRLAAWSFHIFPWYLGKDLTYVPDATAIASLQNLSHHITVKPGLKAKLTWEALDILVIACLAANENEKLIIIRHHH